MKVIDYDKHASVLVALSITALKRFIVKATGQVAEKNHMTDISRG